MKLQNTKQYYRDLAHYYFNEGKFHLMEFFIGLVNNPGYTYSKTDTNDWFESSFGILAGAFRPERDGDGIYVDTL